MRAQGWEVSRSLMERWFPLYHGRARGPFVVRVARHRYNRIRVVRSIPRSSRSPERVKVILRNPRREVAVSGTRRVKDLLIELDILPGTVLVIRGDELLTSDAVVGDEDVLEVRPVMSGGSAASPVEVSR